MTWLTLFTALVGGAACAIISVPLTVWLVLGNLQDEFEALHAIARFQPKQSPPSSNMPGAEPPFARSSPPSGAPAHWPPYAEATPPGYIRGSDGNLRPKEGYPGSHGLRGYDPTGWD